jgi:hypothetical protein
VPKGTIVYAGEPGMTGFATTENGMLAAGTDATAFNEGLQIGPRAGLYRPGVTVYEVLEDTPGAYSEALANAQHGPGGFPQLYIPAYARVLRPIRTDLMGNRVVAIAPHKAVGQ